jgi:hypothetical protein
MDHPSQTPPHNDRDGTAAPGGADRGTKKPRGRPFTGRDDPRNRVPAVPVAKPPAVPFEPGVTLYRDMVHAYTRPRAEDVTQGQKACRQWKQKDLRAFMAKLADLEKTQKPPEPPTEEYLQDAGSDRVESLIDELLRKAAIPSCDERYHVIVPGDVTCRCGAVAVNAAAAR